MDQDTSKRELRLRHLARRRGIPADEHARMSEALCHKLAFWIQARPCQRVFAYAPFRGEPDVTSLLQRLPAMDFFLPVISAPERSMQFLPWKRGAPLKPNRYGIGEPTGTDLAPPPDGRTVILVPGVLMDRRGYRLGYGGGYYDRFLHQAHAAGAVSLGIVFEEFVVSSLPQEAHDVRLHGLATESGVLPWSV